GYQAMFAAYGGYGNRRTDPFNITRIGAIGQIRPLDLILEIEGLSLGAFGRVLKTKLLGAELLSSPKPCVRGETAVVFNSFAFLSFFGCVFILYCVLRRNYKLQ